MSSIMRASQPAELPAPLAVVCHDAGGANLIIHWIGTDILASVQAYMAGPAKLLWERHLPDRPLLGSVEEVLSGAACLLSGTGWASDVEHQARILAATAEIPSVAVLDHWVNFRERFIRGERMQRPDMLVVTDGWALQKAGDLFPEIPVAQWSNRYLDHQLENIGAISEYGDILYIGEPARDDWGRDRPGEFQAIDFFIDNIERIEGYSWKRIRFRPHPSEKPEKYDAIIQSLDYAVLDESASLDQAIDRAAVVAGMGSAAMVVALAAGRKVYGTLPPWAPACPLPQDGIIHLRDKDRS